MAKALENFTFSPRTRSSSYDWDTILSGKLLQLNRGEDFGHANADGTLKNVSTASVVAIAQIHAKNRGLKLRYEIVDDDTIVVQAVPIETETEIVPKARKATPKARKARK